MKVAKASKTTTRHTMIIVTPVELRALSSGTSSIGVVLVNIALAEKVTVCVAAAETVPALVYSTTEIVVV